MIKSDLKSFLPLSVRELTHWLGSKYKTIRGIIEHRNTTRVSNSLDPDQARHLVGPDLGPNYLGRLSDDKSHH